MEQEAAESQRDTVILEVNPYIPQCKTGRPEPGVELKNKDNKGIKYSNINPED